MSKNTKVRENQVRRQLARQGYCLQKSRTDGSNYVNSASQGENMDDRGGYRIVDAGEKFDLSLEDVERLAADKDKDDQEPGLEERAKELDFNLRLDGDGCYWLDYVDLPDMRSRGPFDFDEVEEWITAAEIGLADEQADECVADLRWERLHSKPETQEKIQKLADRYPEVSKEQIEALIKRGETCGLSLEARFVGARMCLSREYGREEFFSLDDVAAALGCTKEEAAAEMKQQNIQCATISTLPGFEWLLGSM